MPRGGARPGAGRKSKAPVKQSKPKISTPRKAAAPPRRPGRPPSERVEAIATQASAMAGYGLPHSDIARFLSIDRDTFTRVYENDLKRGMFQSNARLSQTAFQRAIGSPAEYDEQGRKIREERPGSDTMLIFLCKVRLRWRTTDKDEPPEPNIGGAPVSPFPPDTPRMIIEGQSIEETARVYREIMAARR